MGNILFGEPNYADVGFYTPVLSGGSWLAALPLANAQEKVFSNVARSSDATKANTKLHADLQLARSIRVLAVAQHNLSRSAKLRFRGSSRIAWSGVTLAAGASSGASSITVQCTGSSAMIRSGDTFQLGGTVYTATSSLAIGGNRLRDSEDLTGSPYTASGATVSANAATAPDGTTTMDLLTENTANSEHTISINGGFPYMNATDVVAFSAFVKPNGSRNLRLKQSDNTGDAQVDFDLTTGMVHASATTGIAVILNAGIEALPEGIYRAWVVAQRPSGAAVVNSFDAFLLDASFNATYTGDGASGAYLWGFQIEYATAPTVYKRSGAVIGGAASVTSGSITITPTLAQNQNPGDALTCLCGEYVSTAPVLDSGWMDVWPVVNEWPLPWEHPSFWDGRITEEERQNYPKDVIYAHTGSATGRYWLIEFDDTTNSYVEFGRLFLSQGYQPTRNFIYDDELGWQDDTIVAEAQGAEYFDERTKRRVFNCVIENLPKDEAKTFLFEMQRRLGKSGQFIVILDPDDAANKQRDWFIARNVELIPLRNPNHNLYSAAMQIREIKRA